MKSALVAHRWCEKKQNQNQFFDEKRSCDQSQSVFKIKKCLCSIVNLPLKYDQTILPNQLFWDITQTFFFTPQNVFFH